MPTSRNPFASTFLEKPGRLDSGTARTSISRLTPARRSAAMSSACVAP